MSTTYCTFANALPADSADPNRHYHDHQYGFPLADDNALFGRLLLEINQAGLSWTLMLKKQENFRAAYSGFDIAAVAAYDDGDRARLLADTGIVRNRLKINAAIHNAQQIRRLQREYGSFKAWLDAEHPQPLPQWLKSFKKTAIQIHRRRNHRRIPDELRLSAGRAQPRLSGTCAHPRRPPAVVVCRKKVAITVYSHATRPANLTPYCILYSFQAIPP